MVTNNRGQGLLEFVFVFPLFMAMATALLSLIVLYGGVHYLQFVGEETLYCSLHSDNSFCLRQAQEKIQALPFLHSQIKVDSNGNERHVSLSWQFAPLSLWQAGQKLDWKTSTEVFNE